MKKPLQIEENNLCEHEFKFYGNLKDRDKLVGKLLVCTKCKKEKFITN